MSPLYACHLSPAVTEGRRSRRARCVALAEDFSPRYQCHRDDLVTVDIRGLDRLLGDPRSIGEEIRRSALARGLRVHIGIATTRTTAMVLALARPGADGRPTWKGSGRDCADGHRDPGKDRRSTTETGECHTLGHFDSIAGCTETWEAKHSVILGDLGGETLGASNAGRAGGVAVQRAVRQAGPARARVAGHRARAGCRAARADAGRRAIRVVDRAGVAY